ATRSVQRDRARAQGLGAWRRARQRGGRSAARAHQRAGAGWRAGAGARAGQAPAAEPDRRLAGRGFKRQVPVGPHMADFVSFPLRTVIDLVPADEPEDAVIRRQEKRTWLAAHEYQVIEVRAEAVERDLTAALAALAASVGAG